MTDRPPRLSPLVAPLVREFQRGMPGLSQADVYKSVFAVLALKKGWSKAKIGRYLGISRARVGQKIQKCQQYAQNGDMPNLKLALADAPGNAENGAEATVAFKREQWDDLSFATAMLNKIA